MIPVLQTEYGLQGNCYRACVASIVECRLDEAPDLRDDPDWGEKLQKWLREQGWTCRFSRTPPSGWAIASTRLLDGSIHAIVYRDHHVAHDPSPRPYSLAKSTVLLWAAFKKLEDTIHA